jgi:hypothetical protein
VTDDQRVMVEMVRGWRGSNRDQRFVQWIWNIVGGKDPYYVEDGRLADLMEGYFERGGKFVLEVDEKPQDPPG